MNIDHLNDGDEVDMTDAQIRAFNARESKKRKALLKKQSDNRAKKQTGKARNTSVIRGVAGDDCMEVIALRRIGLDNEITCDVGETISLPKEVVIRLQDKNAVKIIL